jgi:hypothetical protein
VVGLPPKATPEMTASPKAVIEPLASLPGRRRRDHAVVRARGSTNCGSSDVNYCIYAIIDDGRICQPNPQASQNRESLIRGRRIRKAIV